MFREKVTAIASKYLFVTSLIMLFGLLRSDGMHRGFPLYWMLGRHGGHVESAEFFLSFILVLAVVIAADLIAKLIMRTREPELKIIKGAADYTNKPVSVNTDAKSEPTYNTDSADSIEVIVSEADESGEMTDYADSDDHLNIELPKILKQLKTDGSGKIEDKTNNSSGALVGIVVVGLTILLAMMPLFFESDEPFEDYEEDVYDYYILEEGDVTLSNGDDEEYIEPVQSALSNLFTAFMEESNPLGTFTTETETNALYDMASWEEMDYDDRYTYISGSDHYAVCKFDVSDDDGNEYLMAVLLELAQNEVEDEEYPEGYFENEAVVKGVMIYPDDGNIDAYNISDEDEIKASEKRLAERGVSLGQTQKDGVNILLWSDVFETLHLEATDG
ncbi:MAG: hypothetical protein IJH57_01195 [Mogibacterium sp.]|nr:hypothetical protein [Mogibacterium sp.]